MSVQLFEPLLMETVSMPIIARLSADVEMREATKQVDWLSRMDYTTDHRL
jgi:hypothetical protein